MSMLPENEQSVREILAVIEPRILGTRLGGWTCNCGCVEGASAIATKVVPAGNTAYPGQETMWFLWNVQMTPEPGQPHLPWSCGLSQFFPTEELDSLFAQYFGGEEDRKRGSAS